LAKQKAALKSKAEKIAILFSFPIGHPICTHVPAGHNKPTLIILIGEKTRRV
jgi:muramoyltetrapeptide carboxypeptidase LdcA involved in peptidoglycan recycling